MKAREFLRALESNGLKTFDLNDAVKIIRKPAGYVSMFLSSIGEIKRIERGKYYVDGTDPYVIASNLLHPSYISLISALGYYKSITQMPVEIDVMALRQHKALSIEGYRVRFFKIKRRRFFGYGNDDGVFIATPEKAIIDCLSFNVDFFYVSEGFKRLRESLDVTKIKEYAKIMGGRALISKLGFLLDRFGVPADDLLGYRSRMKVYISRPGAEKDSKWGVLYDN